MSTVALSRAQVRDVDRRAIEEFHVPGIVLMENAGRGAAELLLELGVAGPVVVCCGKGNNGGDGFVIARHLENHGCSVRVLLFCDPQDLSGDAEVNYRIIEKAGTPIAALGQLADAADMKQEFSRADWIVDALLGTGTRGEIREPYRSVIDAINASPARVFAIDLPSGLDCDTGQSLGCCVRADHTATFVARKIGFDAPQARQWLGEVHVIDIGVPQALLANVFAAARSTR